MKLLHKYTKSKTPADKFSEFSYRKSPCRQWEGACEPDGSGRRVFSGVPAKTPCFAADTTDLNFDNISVGNDFITFGDTDTAVANGELPKE